MKKLLILSGKGGTGKTTTALAFINFSLSRAFADCDVDAPNLHLGIKKLGYKSINSDFYGGSKAFVNTDFCNACEKCVNSCKFNAIKIVNQKAVVNEIACEGCGVCRLVCDKNAVTLKPDVAGKLTLYNNEFVFSTAKLKMGRGNSGKLVSEVKKSLINNASEHPLAIIDGSPGIGCPVISSISGVDLVLIVAEPSNSGISDLERLVKTATNLGVKIAVCVNKSDVNEQKSLQIEEFCNKNSIKFVGKIPFDKQISQLINDNLSFSDINCPAKEALFNIYLKTIALL